jgi:hypothetical protein
MTNSNELLNGYLDQSLTPEQHTQLQLWLAESPENIRQFTELLLLDNQLRSEALLISTGLIPAPVGSVAAHESAPEGLQPPDATASPPQRLPSQAAPNTVSRSRRYLRRFSGFAATFVLTLAVLLLFRPGGENFTAVAASAEISSLITKNKLPKDRTYHISVESSVPVDRRRNRQNNSEKRPPKPPMDDAVLHVAGNGQFVLIRRTQEGRTFITGSNGSQSWAVRPGSPVRTSSDLQRFSRDLPGHEHSLSLTELPLTLQQLQRYFDVQIVNAGPDEETAASLLIAARRPGSPGPRRIEIEYDSASHEIHQIRFIDMPYGPERLTLRLTLTSRESQPAGFYNHPAHHAPDLPVEQE